MRNHLSLISILAGSALLAVPAHAEDSPQASETQTNVFNADMSNPDLAAVITSFEEVCLPFITHTTELPQSLNQDHRLELLAEQGFEFQSRESKPDRVIFEPAREEWKPASQQINRKKVQFTVFNGVSNQLVESTETVVDQLRETGRTSLTSPRYKKIVRDMDIYVPEKDKRQTALLQWNYASQNHPAKSCEIKIEAASLSAETFEAAFLDKDPDWREAQGKNGTWAQCTIDGADQFRFAATREDEQLSLSVMRNDFFALKMCRARK